MKAPPSGKISTFFRIFFWILARIFQPLSPIFWLISNIFRVISKEKNNFPQKCSKKVLVLEKKWIVFCYTFLDAIASVGLHRIFTDEHSACRHLRHLVRKTWSWHSGHFGHFGNFVHNGHNRHYGHFCMMIWDDSFEMWD